jgi:VWFA-related protein
MAIAAVGQTTPPAPGVVIRSTTQLVQVHVVATDSNDKPVTDLRRQDFEIFSDRKSQRVAFFSTAAEVHLGVQPGAQTATSDNDARPSAGYALILLDWLNTALEHRMMAEDHVVKLIRNFQPRQRVALYLLGQNSRLLRDFTSDHDILLESLQAADNEPLSFVDTVPGRFDARFAGKSAPTPGSAEMKNFFLDRDVNESCTRWNSSRITSHASPGERA